MLFTGDPIQRLDGKGRFLLPARMREVLDHGSGGRTEGGASLAVLHYGLHLKNHLRIYSRAAWDGIVASVMAMPVGSAERRLNEYVYLTQHQQIESDREGRFVLPARFRERLGVEEGDIQLLGKGDYVELWNPAVHEEAQGRLFAEMLAKLGDGFDPIALASKPAGG